MFMIISLKVSLTIFVWILINFEPHWIKTFPFIFSYFLKVDFCCTMFVGFPWSRMKICIGLTFLCRCQPHGSHICILFQIKTWIQVQWQFFGVLCWLKLKDLNVRWSCKVRNIISLILNICVVNSILPQRRNCHKSTNAIISWEIGGGKFLWCSV